jgi:hypothetical protein
METLGFPQFCRLRNCRRAKACLGSKFQCMRDNRELLLNEVLPQVSVMYVTLVVSAREGDVIARSAATKPSRCWIAPPGFNPGSLAMTVNASIRIEPKLMSPRPPLLYIAR